jgi:phosphatidylglycerol:prolipoprotein diacylglycerol transferase
MGLYPVLFHIGSIPVETYYAFWFAALSLALLWVVRRFFLYGVDEDEGRRVISWGFIGMLVGARAFEYVWNFSVYWDNPSLMLDLNRGGLAEVGALSGAWFTVWLLCRRNPKISFSHLCEVCIPPSFFAIAMGRWGCFFAGCCVGVSSSFPTALHFPYDIPSVTRHPTQLYYSFAAAVILSILLIAEKKILRRGRIPRHALLTPLGFALYSIMRFSIDTLRAETSADGLSLSHKVLAVALLLEILWLLVSWRTFRKDDIQNVDRLFRARDDANP